MKLNKFILEPKTKETSDAKGAALVTAWIESATILADYVCWYSACFTTVLGVLNMYVLLFFNIIEFSIEYFTEYFLL